MIPFVKAHACGNDFLDERLDVGAEELGGLVAGLADQVEVPRVPVRMLEAEAALAEIHFARDARVHHPLQGAVDGGAADAMIFLANQFDQIVGAQVAFLAQEHVDDEIAFARALAARGTQPIEIEGGGSHVGSEAPQQAAASRR